MNQFEQYKDRKIEFLGVQSIRDWSVKVYTISVNDSFQSGETLNAVLTHLGSDFIGEVSRSKLPVHKHGFVVVHEAREGVWILFSWWTGGEMLETIVRFSSFEESSTVRPSLYSGSLVCVWELEVYIHERRAWIQHVLKNASAPDFQSYKHDGLNGKQEA